MKKKLNVLFNYICLIVVYILFFCGIIITNKKKDSINNQNQHKENNKNEDKRINKKVTSDKIGSSINNWRLGIEGGILLLYGGIFSSYKFNKYIELNLGGGMKFFGFASHYYLRLGTIIYPIQKVKNLNFNISYMPTFETMYNGTKHVINVNWTAFYLDIGYTFKWGGVGIGSGLVYTVTEWIGDKTAKGILPYPVIFINFDFVHLFL